jgi:phosphoribosylformylglycinamidine cyclo-ligase
MYNPTKPYTKQIIELIKETWDTPFVSVKNGIILKKFAFPEACSSDGIGTKGIFHWRCRSFRNAVLDALAMNLNDLVLLRARPYKLQNHILIPKEDNEAIIEIISKLSDECKKRNIAITGGETSIHDNIIGMDISITADGFVEMPKVNKFEFGDVLIGIKSNGLHSNGFTKVREIFGDEFKDEFIEPTLIYSDIILDVNKNYDIHGMMHITGGAFSKLKPLLKNTDVFIKREHKLKPQKIFFDIYSKGVSSEEMYSTFNCGVGFILGVPKRSAYGILSDILRVGFKADIIGEIVPGEGNIKIESSFDEKIIIL